MHELIPAVDYLANALGFHEFAEFVADDVGTLDSGLNSMVLASNNEMVLLPVNEPTFGTKRKSQIQNFLEQNEVRPARRVFLASGALTVFICFLPQNLVLHLSLFLSVSALSLTLSGPGSAALGPQDRRHLSHGARDEGPE